MEYAKIGIPAALSRLFRSYGGFRIQEVSIYEAGLEHSDPQKDAESDIGLMRSGERRQGRKALR